MALSNLPSAFDVRVASRLQPRQVSPTFTSTDVLEEDIAARLAAQADMVESRIQQQVAPLAWPLSDDQLAAAYPAFASEQRDAVTTRQQATAARAVNLFTLSDLYDSAGQLSPAYQAEANNYERRAEKEMTNLLNELTWISAQSGGSVETDSAQVLTIRVGENFAAEDEYGCGY